MFGILLPSSFTRVVRSTPYTVWGERGGQEEVGGCGESEEGKGGEEEKEEEEAEKGRRRGGGGEGKRRRGEEEGRRSGGKGKMRRKAGAYMSAQGVIHWITTCISRNP